MTMKKNHDCPICGNDKSLGRSDKKYCSTKCRNKKNNRIYKSINSDTQRIDQILHRNYQILKQLQVSKLTRNELTSLGFNLRYFTHQTRLKKDNTSVYCVYHLGYYYGSDKLIYIVEIKN